MIIRIYIPEMYGYKSVKWLQGIQVTDKDATGYWEALGYPADAWPNKGGGI